MIDVISQNGGLLGIHCENDLAIDYLVEKLLADSDSKDKALKIAKQIYMLAVLSQRPLTVEEMNSFITDSQDILLES